MNRFIKFIWAVLITTTAIHAADFAPESLKGKSAIVVITDGTGIFATIGGYRISFSPTANTYVVSPLSWNLLPSAGTYTYVKLTATTGRITITDTVVGSAVPMNMVFTSETSASYASTFGTSRQSGTAVLENVTQTIASDGDRIINMSVRAFVPADSQTIPGIVITQPVTVLIRASGPALGKFGVSPVVANPKLKLFKGDTIIAENDDWSADAAEGDAIALAAQNSGAFAITKGSLDAAVIRTLQPGAYTAVITGGKGESGEVLLEVYRVP